MSPLFAETVEYPRLMRSPDRGQPCDSATRARPSSQAWKIRASSIKAQHAADSGSLHALHLPPHCSCQHRLQSPWRFLPKYTSSSWVCLHPLVRCSTVMISVSLPRSLPPRLSRASSMSPATMRLARLCLSSQVVHSLELPSLVLLVTGSVDD